MHRENPYGVDRESKQQSWLRLAFAQVSGLVSLGGCDTALKKRFSDIRQ